MTGVQTCALPISEKAKEKIVQFYNCKVEKNPFKAKDEKLFAAHLIDEGVRWEYEPDTFWYTPPKAAYTPDWKIYNDDGSYFYIETKGFFRPEHRKIIRAVMSEHSDLDLRLVFFKPNNKLTRGKNSLRYWQWAERYGFLWANNELPKEWIKNDT